MKEHSYTIPLNEAFEQDSFCPFCYIREKLERDAVEYTLGPAMMEPDFRIMTNEKGFCQKHMRDLHGLRNALSLSLIAETHLRSVDEFFEGIICPEKKSLFKKEKSKKATAVEKLKKLSNSCAVCDKIENTFSAYLDTFVFMLKTEKGFTERVLEKDGFCMEHFALIAERAYDKLSDAEFEKFFVPIAKKQKERVEKYTSDIKCFADSFDYRNAGKPLAVPKDTLLKTGYLLNGEFEPKF